jgi:hypothetical protein
MYEIARREGRQLPAAHEGEFQAYHMLTLMMIGGEDGGGRTEFTTHLMVRATVLTSSSTMTTIDFVTEPVAPDLCASYLYGDESTLCVQWLYVPGMAVTTFIPGNN